MMHYEYHPIEWDRLRQMPDSRYTQAAALIDDARCLLADIAEGMSSDPLEAARVSLNCALAHLHVLARGSDG